MSTAVKLLHTLSPHIHTLSTPSTHWHPLTHTHLQKLGISIPDLVVCQPDHGEQAFNVMDDLVRSGAVSLIVVDSVSALVPRCEIEGDIGTPQVGWAQGGRGWGGGGERGVRCERAQGGGGGGERGGVRCERERAQA